MLVLFTTLPLFRFVRRKICWLISNVKRQKAKQNAHHFNERDSKRETPKEKPKKIRIEEEEEEVKMV